MNVKEFKKEVSYYENGGENIIKRILGRHNKIFSISRSNDYTFKCKRVVMKKPY